MSAATPALRRRLGSAAAGAVDVGEYVAFWAGVALPCLHLPLLAYWGVTPETAAPLVALWTAHAVALLAGRRYRPRPDGGE